MALIVASPETDHDRLRLVWANDAGIIQLIHPDGRVERQVRTGSVVRDIAWPVADTIYILLENRQIKVIDPDSFAVKNVIEGFCASIAVSQKGTLIGGQLRGRQIRSACFIGFTEDHVLAFADGHLEIVSQGATKVIPPDHAGRGEYESFVLADPVHDTIVVSQTALSDRQGFSDVSIRLLARDGSVRHQTQARMSSPAAITSSPVGTLIYEQHGLTEVRTGKILRKADGYPLTGLVAVGSKTVRIFGIRSDNTLTFMDVT